MAMSRIGILGLGLIGGSIARGLVARGHEVIGVEPDDVSREAAQREGVSVVGSVRELCALHPDLVFVAVPLRAMRESMGELALHAHADLLVTDVGSVKQPIAAMAQELGLAHRYVGAHPMAGTELAGFNASSAELLLAAPWALTITEDTPREGFLRILQLLCRDLRGRVIPLRPDVHDASVALTSHLPHVAANGLLNLVGSSEHADTAFALAAGSFRDGTRVGGTNPRRTEAMVVDNQTWVVPGIRALADELVHLADDIAAGADTSWFFDRALAAKQKALIPRPAQRALDLAALSDDEWRATLLDVGRKGDQIIALSDALVATIAE